ncbi:hypothetical protein [Rubinisphaera margarita]|uniref:hypothetical protein n=1 Tax=Rubinisphaera margarita TaxID=2909586 RepID=UPI001EE8F2A0|nr:hypothetical protein [Rubinisphaera margarita]MCG6156847.1 hypothetical protein [Rubinisphaera margarita]
MGKWSAFLISLIPAALAGYLGYLLVTIGLPVVEDRGAMFWVPLGAGLAACLMSVLAPFGIAIFARSEPKMVAVTKEPREDLELSGADEEFMSDDEVVADSEFASDDELDAGGYDDEDDFSAEDFASDDEIDSSSNYETAEIASDEFSEEFDEFELTDENDEDDDLFK